MIFCGTSLCTGMDGLLLSVLPSVFSSSLLLIVQVYRGKERVCEVRSLKPAADYSFRVAVSQVVLFLVCASPFFPLSVS